MKEIKELRDGGEYGDIGLLQGGQDLGALEGVGEDNFSPEI